MFLCMIFTIHTYKVQSDIVLQKAGLQGLNEMVATASAFMVWKSKTVMNPLGLLLFPTETDNFPEKMTQFTF